MNVESLDESDTPEVLDGVFLTQLAAGDRMSVQHFRIEPGAVVDDHSHGHEQAGYLFGGSILFTGTRSAARLAGVVRPRAFEMVSQQ